MPNQDDSVSQGNGRSLPENDIPAGKVACAHEKGQQAAVMGLSADEVAARVASGDVNVDAGVKTRSVKEIVRDNVCTLFNLVNVILAVLVFITGSYKNMLFMIVIVCNTVIGIVQEIRSKRTTDKLSIIAGTKAEVVRDGARVELPLDQLVRDDIVVLGRGDQVPADALVVSGECDANESLLTGESKLIKKRAGDSLMSGSFVNSGTVYARIEHVGAENYAAKISAEAKQHKAVNSEIMNSLNGIIKFVSCIMFPLGALLFATEYFLSGTEFNSAILSTVSALVGMIPEGLILLTSTVLAVAVVRLAKSEVLVQQLYCIETLARVDTLCLDKTGTITTGDMEVAWVAECDFAQQSRNDSHLNLKTAAERNFAQQSCGDSRQNLEAKRDFAKQSRNDSHQSLKTAAERNFAQQSRSDAVANDALMREIDQAFLSIAVADDDPNETARAILAYYGVRADGDVAQQAHPHAQHKVDPLPCERPIPFSSDRKYSGAVLADGRAYAMGAAQFILKDNYDSVKSQVEELSAQARLLLLARVDGFDADGNLLGTPQPIGFVGIRDQIRTTAAQTIGYFKDQGVRVIVISGDDPRTVSGIAAQVGIENADRFVDATTLSSQADIERAIAEYSVFGRVKPEQKKAFVLALQKAGHTVAMTGDGVNDTLALKAADCSVAMAAGSDAARNVAQLVLVDNDFASMPKVVAEGRRSINNLQRSASLFLVKTLLSIACAVIFVLAPWQYPFQPIQMTLISAFTIGIPSFVLALEPNHDRIKGHFLENVIVRSIPGALCSVVSILVANIAGYALGMDYGQVSTMCVLLTSWVGINLVVRLSWPLTPIRAALLVVVVGGTVGGHLLLPGLFSLVPYTLDMGIIVLIMGVVAAVAFHYLYFKLDTWHAERQSKLV